MRRTQPEGTDRGVRPWRVETARTEFEHPLLRLETQDLRAGEDRRQAVVLRSTDWVNVIPLIEEDDAAGADRKGPTVVLVRQWRFGRAAESLEIPGGMVEPGEDPGVAAARELHEETGYRAATVERLGEVEPNPAILDNVCSLWLARGLVSTGDPIGDGTEEIEVVHLPLHEIPGLIETGGIRHSLVVAAFHFLARRRGLP